VTGWRASAKYFIYTVLAGVMGHLPEPIARVVVGAVVRTMAWWGGPALEMNARHMRRILMSECAEGVEPDPALLARWSRRTYVEYGRYWLDGARLPYVSPEGVYARMQVEGDSMANIGAGLSKGRGVILALPHVGSWEWGGRFLVMEGMPMTAVVERLEPERLFEWFVRQRAAMGITAVPLGEGSGAPLLKALKENQLLALVGDRDLAGNGVPVEFFGERTTLPSGAAMLALRTGAALLPLAVYAGPDDWHNGVVYPALDTARRGSVREDVQRLTQELATCFEDFIRRHPEQWHMYQPNWPSDEPETAGMPPEERRMQAGVAPGVPA
jgi:KDO2-lipid IV(A) lauroyltransferase